MHAISNSMAHHFLPRCGRLLRKSPAAGERRWSLQRTVGRLGVIHLKDVVKGGMKERFAQLRAMGIRTVMITGDNPLTAAAIAREAGVDDFLAEAKPKDKMDLIRREQSEGKLVAMTGDGTNDAPALAQADVGVAMNSGTQAAKEAGNMVDLDSNPTKLIEIVAIGKQLLMTRGALTTFFYLERRCQVLCYHPRDVCRGFSSTQCVNIMHLHSPESAILSAVIFIALIFIVLISAGPAGCLFTERCQQLRCCRGTCLSTDLGGIIVPFIGIKLIDIFITLPYISHSWLSVFGRHFMKKHIVTSLVYTACHRCSAGYCLSAHDYCNRTRLLFR